jgi:ubiquinone/menaquinone biosynthesis C-methylase UbiE
VLSRRNSDLEWATWGETNPYFGVLSAQKFSDPHPNDELLQQFFASGERDIDRTFRIIGASVKPDFQPARVLDYGCGVGRLVVPLTKRASEVVGVDVSPGMLEQARVNCRKFGAAPVSLLHVDEMHSLEPTSFDFVHCFIVLQHIPPKRGELILKKLISLLATGGVAAIHVTYGDSNPILRRGMRALRDRVYLVHCLLNLIQRRPVFQPQMQMNSYSMNRIFSILNEELTSNLHIDFTDHGGHKGAMLYFEKL